MTYLFVISTNGHQSSTEPTATFAFRQGHVSITSLQTEYIQNSKLSQWCEISIMGSRITDNSTVCSKVFSKRTVNEPSQPVLLVLCEGIHQGPVIPLTRVAVQKCFHVMTHDVGFLCCWPEQTFKQTLDLQWIETPWHQRDVTVIRNVLLGLILITSSRFVEVGYDTTTNLAACVFYQSQPVIRYDQRIWYFKLTANRGMIKINNYVKTLGGYFERTISHYMIYTARMLVKWLKSKIKTTQLI